MTWSLQTATVTTNATNSPAGTTTADKLITNNAQGIGAANQDFVKAASAITYTISVFAKASEHSALRFILRDPLLSANRADVVFSLSTKTFSFPFVGGTYSGHSYSFVEYPNDWIRVFMTATTGSEIALRAQVINNTTGDGTSGLFVWGAQLEAGAFPTSYIPTTTATVTRSADVASISGSNFSSWFTNANENTFYVEAIKTAANAANGTFFCGSDSSVNALAGGWIVYNPAGERMRFQSRHSSVRGDTQNNAAVITSGALIKGALCTSTTTFGASYNGSLIASISTPAQLDWSTSLAIGWFPNGGYTNALNGTIRRLTYWPTRLPNPTLQAVTQ
jgi:hypothetical protein